MADLNGINNLGAPGQLVALVAGLGGGVVTILEVIRCRRASARSQLSGTV